jgi:hypothetical protein
MGKLNIIKLFILIFVQLSFGQINSILIDENTKIPITYAKIWIENEIIETFSNDKGYFSLITKSENDSIIISHIGFKTKKIAVSEIKDTILLKSSILKFEEVFVSQRKNKKQFTVNRIDEKKIDWYFGTGVDNHWLFAKYFPFNKKYNETKFLKKISLFTGVNKKVNFNIRLYSTDKDGKPLENLTPNNIIATAKKGYNKTEINVIDLNILFPENGLFVAIENVEDINSNEFKNTSLVFGLDLSNKSEQTYYYYKGEWVKNIDVDENKKYDKMIYFLSYSMIELTLTD